MENTLGYELSNGGSIPSGRANQWRVGTLGVDRFRSPAHLAVGDCSIQLSSSKSYGNVAERPIASVLKTEGSKGPVSSNLTVSAKLDVDTQVE